MKILYFSHQSNYLYGAEICTLELLQKAKEKHTVWFAAPKGKYFDRAKEFVTCIATPSIEFQRKPRYVIGFLWAFCCTFFRLYFFIQKEKISLVHATTLKSMVYVWPLSFFLPIKVIWHHHDILPKTKANAYWVALLAKAANNIIVPSRATKLGLETLGVEAKKITVIPNGFSAEKFKRSGITNTYRESQLKKFQIGIVGELSYRKGLDWLEKIVSIVEDRIPGNCKFTVIGAALSEPEFAAKIYTENEFWVKRGIVEFLGRRENILHYLQEFSCLLVPSRQDPLPTVIIEASFSQIPCIATPVGGIPEMIEDGYNGFLCRTPGEFAEKIIYLVRNIDICKKMGAIAQKAAEQKFSSNAMWLEMEKVYLTSNPS